MIHLFQEDAPRLLAAMRDALQRGDMAVLERSAHSLKGAAGNLSAKIRIGRRAAARKGRKKQGRENPRKKVSRSWNEPWTNCFPRSPRLCQGVTK